jgi:hypothetical protein
LVSFSIWLALFISLYIKILDIKTRFKKRPRNAAQPAEFA